MTAQNGRSLPEVLQDIVGNIQEIIRSEIQLAKTEIKEEATKASTPIKLWIAGAVLGMYALVFILFTIVMAMATVMATWLAALVVGAILSVVSMALVSAGAKRLKHVSKVPERTVETMKENVQWAKNQIK